MPVKDTRIDLNTPEGMAKAKEILARHNMKRWTIRHARKGGGSYCYPSQKLIVMARDDMDTLPGTYTEYDRVKQYLTDRGFNFDLAPAFPCALLHEIVHWRVHTCESKTDGGRRRTHGPEFKRNLLSILKTHVPYAFEQAETA